MNTENRELAGHFLEDFGGKKGHWQQCKEPIPGMTQPLYKDAKAANAAAPDVSDLLTMAVECRLIRLSQVMNTDIQDALAAFARRLLA